MTDQTTRRKRALPWLRRLRHAGLALAPLRGTLLAEPRPRGAAEARADIAIALIWAGLCHTIFAVAVLAMIAGMWFGMQAGFGQVPGPWSWAANLALLAQFPLVHSLLLTARGRRVLGRLGPRGRGPVLATTTYAIVASVQLAALFLLWTPSGVVWWQAEGATLWLIAVLYAASWGLLVKASWDAGAEVQSGLLGWASLARGVRPVFPPMPEGGLFRLVRQPIYVSFALTTWTVPVWSPDQLLVAVVFTLYCLIGPLAKERRFDRLFGARWRDYRARTPYWLPRPARPDGGTKTPPAPDGADGAA